MSSSCQFVDPATYQLLVESMHTDAVIMLDPDGYIRSWNSGASNITGYQAPEVLGQNFSCFFANTEQAQGLPQQQLKAATTQGRLEQAGWRVRKDGSQFWASVVITALRDANGDLLGFSHVTQDITDRKQTEEALQQSNTLLRSIMESLPDVIFAKDSQGRYVTINSSGANFLKQSIEEVIGQDDAALFPPETARHIMQQDQDIMRTGNTESIEDVLPSQDGQWRTYLSTKTPWRDAQGNIIGIIGISRDISDRKHIEESLRQEKDFTHLVVESVSEGVVVCDAEGKLKFFNGTARDWHGCDLTTVPPELWADQYSLYEADGVTPLALERIPLIRAFNGERVRDAAIAIVAKGQPPRYILASGDPLFDQEGHKIGAVVVMHDITARKQAEAEQARLVAILEATPDFVGIADASGRSIYVNQSGLKMVGLDEVGDITSLGIPDFVPASALDTVLHEHLPIAVRDGLWSGEGILQHQDGTQIPVLQVIMAHQSEGGVEFFSTIARDISDRKQSEAALQQLTHNLQEAQRLAHIGNWDFDVLTGEITWTDEVYRIFGLEPGQPTPTYAELLELYHPQDRERFQHLVSRAIAAGESYDTEFRLVRPDGSIRYVIAKGEVTLEGDQAVRIFGTTLDITELKQAEKDQARLGAILEATTDFVSIAEVATGRLIYTNQAGRHMLGIEATEDISHLSIGDLIGQSKAELAHNERLQAVLRDGIWVGESTLHHRNGRIIPVSQVLMTHKSENGEVELISSIARDISDRKQIEATLQESEARFRHAAATAQAQAQQLEQTLHELQQTQAQLIQHEKMSSLGQLVAGVAHEINNPVNFIYGNLTHAGEYTRDLMNLLKLYQAHYPTPAPEIEAETEAIDLEFLMEDLPKLLSSMKVGADRIQKIVLSLRNFSRMDEADMKTVDLHEGIDSTLMILQNRLKAKSDHPEIKVLKDYGALPPVECYAGQLNQVLMNILTNAIDALEDSNTQRSTQESQSPKTIHIQTQTVTPDRVQISIRDTGPGIPEEVQRRLFTPFFTTKPVGKGTGLGLSISYQIITEKHGGTLQCFSAPGQGTEFLIEIPVRQS